MNKVETNIPSIYAVILPSGIGLEEVERGKADAMELAERLIKEEEEKEKGERKTLIMGLGEFQELVNYGEGFTDFLNDSYVQFVIKLNDKEERK